MKRSTNFRGKAGKHLTARNLQGLMNHFGVTPGKLGCSHCESEAEPGYIETGNNGPIVPCPVCNPDKR